MRQPYRAVLGAVVWAAAFLAGGCGPFDRPSAYVAERDVIGKFEITWDPAGVILGKETLSLKSDHQFVQVFVPTGGKPRRNSGRWTFRPGRNAEVELDGLVQYMDPSSTRRVAAKPEATNAFSPVSKHGKTVWILVNDDLGLYYRKR